MKTTKEFNPTDRYIYDFRECTTGKGFAQIDTSQDASYYGTWANPFKLIIFSYAEGDTILQECDNEKEFVREIKALKKWNNEMGCSFGIDPGFNAELKEKFITIGLSDLLH